MSGTQSTKSIILRIKKVENKFNSFWLKSVEDVDLSQHCIKCLIGERNYAITQDSGCTVSLNPQKIWYLCGVTRPYKWENNFHLAFEYSAGDIFTVQRNGVTLKVFNAKEIPISPDDINPDDPHASNPKYSTCRNWQFANYFAKKYGIKQLTLF